MELKHTQLVIRVEFKLINERYGSNPKKPHYYEIVVDS